jgi:RNA polymerase sigma-70 factor, ECF subfamily
MSRSGLNETIRVHLGWELRSLYHELITDTIPDDLSRLTKRLEQTAKARGEPIDREFLKQLIDCLPMLRGFAISLTRDGDRAEDLIQDTILKALKHRSGFAMGTNLGAWLVTILRNKFRSDYRRNKREVEDVDGRYAATLITIPDQGASLDLQDLEAALAELPVEQRDALLLVVADGKSYEEAGEILGVRTGTIKSRVSRARNKLAELLGIESDDDIGAQRLLRL